MPIFRFNYNKPGPGVDPDEPRKKGIKRFFEVLGRDFGGFVMLNLFYCVFMLVPLILFLFSSFGMPAYVFILALVAAIPMGGVYCTIVYCITKMLRDDPEYVWYDIKRKFVQYFKQGIIPGTLYTAYLFGQIFFIFALMAPEGFDVVSLTLMVISLTVIGMVTPYIFIQIAYVELSLIQIIKNSFILALINAPRSFMGSFMGNLIWFIFWLLIPLSLFAVPIMLLIAFSLSWLMCLMWVWPRVDKQFNIEDTLRERYDKKLEDKMR